MVQIAIFLLSGASIWLIGRKEDWSKWGYFIGLLSQPFWIYTSFVNEQWGIFLLGIWYTYAWCQGIWNFIIDPLLIDEELFNG